MSSSGILILLGFLSGSVGSAPAPLSVPSLFPYAQYLVIQQQVNRDEAAKTFLGTIVKDGDKYVLSDDARKVWYELDDQQTVSRFNGKKVKVTGRLDATRNLIRIQSIEEAAT